MWNLSFEPPQIVQARVLAPLPEALRLRRASDWAAANKPGQTVDSFLEGPAFDRAGNLYLTDIVHGRIFRLAPAGQWPRPEARRVGKQSVITCRYRWSP